MRCAVTRQLLLLDKKRHVDLVYAGCLKPSVAKHGKGLRAQGHGAGEWEQSGVGVVKLGGFSVRGFSVGRHSRGVFRFLFTQFRSSFTRDRTPINVINVGWLRRPSSSATAPCAALHLRRAGFAPGRRSSVFIQSPPSPRNVEKEQTHPPHAVDEAGRLRRNPPSVPPRTPPQNRWCAAHAWPHVGMCAAHARRVTPAANPPYVLLLFLNHYRGNHTCRTSTQIHQPSPPYFQGGVDAQRTGWLQFYAQVNPQRQTPSPNSFSPSPCKGED